MNRQERLEQLFQTMTTITHWSAQRQRHEPMPTGIPTNTRMRILVAIARADVVSIKDLAKQFHMTSSAATQLVNTLVDDKLVMRKNDKDDRRKTRLLVTTAGRKTLLLAKKRCLKIVTDLFKPLSEEDLQTLHTLHEKIVAHLQTVWTDPQKTLKQ